MAMGQQTSSKNGPALEHRQSVAPGNPVSCALRTVNVLVCCCCHQTIAKQQSSTLHRSRNSNALQHTCITRSPSPGSGLHPPQRLVLTPGYTTSTALSLQQHPSHSRGFRRGPDDRHDHRQGATSSTSRVTSLQGQSGARSDTQHLRLFASRGPLPDPCCPNADN